MLKLDIRGALPFIGEAARADIRPRVLAAHQSVTNGTGAGREMLGWQTLAASDHSALVREIEEVASEIRDRADVLLCIGIGGSYLGAKAVIDALSSYFPDENRGTEVVFAGHHMSGSYLRDLLAHLEGKSVYVNIISKSGTTLEPALAFRLVREWMQSRFDDLDRRIIVTTDPERGALNALRGKYGFRRFVIPPDIGGRFSVLTPVGLLPIASAGIDIAALLAGASTAYSDIRASTNHPALEYAGVRSLLHRAGYATELLAFFEPCLAGIGGWWQQLFGESEGKDRKGLFPAYVQYSTDLHSVGQYVQDGVRNIMETFLLLDDDQNPLLVPGSSDTEDGLTYLEGKSLSYINRCAFDGTAKAHSDGGVPTMTISLSELSPTSLGYLIYTFEHAVAVSGYLIGVNPFDQPGVEAYKKEMFKRLGRP